MNKVILMGRLTREPDVRYSQNARRFYGSCQIYIGCRQKTWKKQ